MPQTSWVQSVVTRLVAVFALASLVTSITLIALEVRRTEALLRLEHTNRLALSARGMRQALLTAMPRRSADEIESIMRLFLTDTASAARVRGEATAVSVGDWPDDSALRAARRWPLIDHALAPDQTIPLDQPTVVTTELLTEGRPLTLELLVDGPALRWRLRQRIFLSFGWHALFLSVATLLGLLLLRRWFTGPLSQVVALIDRGADAPAFRELATSSRDEFARLARALGNMLDSLAGAHADLRRREQAFGHLYEFAPAAMLSLDHELRIIRANRNAAALLATANAQALIGRPVVDFLHPDSRARLARVMEGLADGGALRCELTLSIDGHTREVVAQCAPARSVDDTRNVIRLALVDVTGLKTLERELADHARLLRLIFDHMSDAIVLVSAGGRVIAHNRQLQALLRRAPDELEGAAYDAQFFWEPLQIRDRVSFLDRHREIEADARRPAQQRVETFHGAFLFQGIPIQDQSGRLTGRLWVVQETTAQDQRQRLLVQQTRQLDALKRLGKALEVVGTTDELLACACEELWQATDAEAVGIVIRDPAGRDGRRARHLIHRGTTASGIQHTAGLLDAIERGLLPALVESGAVTCWQEPDAQALWRKAFEQAGLIRIAGRPLAAGHEPLGAIWLARQSGRVVDRSHLHLLDAAGPLIAARVELVQWLDELTSLNLLDQATHLPTAEFLRIHLGRLAVGNEARCTLLEMRLDERAIVDPWRWDGFLAAAATELRRINRKPAIIVRLSERSLGVLVTGTGGEEVEFLTVRLRTAISRLASAEGLDPNIVHWSMVSSPQEVRSPAGLIAALGSAGPVDDAGVIPELLAG